MKKFIAVIAIALMGFLAVGCSEGPGQNTAQQARQNDENASSQALVQLQTAQPTPKFDYSQIRQNLIELQTAQANATQTTTFFFLEGVDKPIDWCPSIGAPIASTTQLTNPMQAESSYQSPYTLPQVEVTGVYTGDSSGTYVICIDGNGQAYANYWEGYTKTIFGPATWNDSTKSIELTGPPSFDFSEGQG